MKAEKRKKHKKKKAENKENDDSDDQFKLEDVISLGGTQVSIFCVNQLLAAAGLVFNILFQKKSCTHTAVSQKKEVAIGPKFDHSALKLNYFLKSDFILKDYHITSICSAWNSVPATKSLFILD